MPLDEERNTPDAVVVAPSRRIGGYCSALMLALTMLLASGLGIGLLVAPGTASGAPNRTTVRVATVAADVSPSLGATAADGILNLQLTTINQKWTVVTTALAQLNQAYFELANVFKGT